MSSLLTDDRARGFTSQIVAQSRYTGFQADELEAHGMVFGLIPEGSKVLDVGCGTGAFAESLVKMRRCKVTGLEPHAGRAKEARDRGLTVLEKFLNPETFDSDNKFDVITFMDVLEHTHDPVELLITARALLHPKGRIIISVPNIAHFTVRFRLLMGRFDYEPTGIMDATHLRWFTQKTTSNMLQAAGLRLLKYDVSRGLGVGFYRDRPILRSLSLARRRKLIDWLCKKWPRLFGFQHIILAEVA